MRRPRAGARRCTTASPVRSCGTVQNARSLESYEEEKRTFADDDKKENKQRTSVGDRTSVGNSNLQRIHDSSMNFTDDQAALEASAQAARLQIVLRQRERALAALARAEAEGAMAARVVRATAVTELRVRHKPREMTPEDEAVVAAAVPSVPQLASYEIGQLQFFFSNTLCKPVYKYKTVHLCTQIRADVHVRTQIYTARASECGMQK